MVTDQQIITAVSELSKRGYAPSVREVGRAVGFRSSSTAYMCLARLCRQGLIEWEASRVRTLRVMDSE